MEAIFEKASRIKLVIKASNGVLKVEDLWDLSLEALDAIAKSLNKQIKDGTEESYIKAKTETNTLLQLRFDIVKHIIDVKLAEAAAAVTAAEKRRKRQVLLKRIAEVQDEALTKKSLEELQKELNDLEE